MHDLVVGNGWVTPNEFWRELSPGEIWWVVRSRRPKEPAEHQDTNARLYRMLKEARAKEAERDG